MTSSPERGRGTWLVWGSFAVLVLIALGLDQARRSATERLDQRVKALAARGKPTRFEEVLGPQISEERNAAMLLENDAEPWTVPMKRFEARLVAGQLGEHAEQLLNGAGTPSGAGRVRTYSANEAMSIVVEDPLAASEDDWLLGGLMLESLGPELALLDRIVEREDWRFSDPFVFSGVDHLRRSLKPRHLAGVDVEPWLSYAAVWSRFAMLERARAGDVEGAVELGLAASRLLRATDSQPWVTAWTVGAHHRVSLWGAFEHVAELLSADADLSALALEVEKAPIEFDWSAHVDAHRVLQLQSGFLDPLPHPSEAGIEIAGEPAAFQETTTRVFDAERFLEIGLELETALTLGPSARRRRFDEVLSQDSSWLHPTAIQRWRWPGEPIETLQAELRTTRERVLQRLRR